MGTAGSASEHAGPRVRHRSRRRKIAESVGLIVGVPLLLLALLALSVELIEYHPVGEAKPYASRPQPPKSAQTNPATQPPPASVLDVPPFDPETGLRRE